jgi:hypothetical protein
MRRDELEHIIRAAGAIINDKHLIIVGSQSILGQYPVGLPSVVTHSIEADILPMGGSIERKGDVIEGALGDGSPFWETFGIWAHGVEEDTLTLPQGWRDRLIPICNDNTLGITGYCLEVHDLLVSKYVAGREKDLRYCFAVAKAGLVNKESLLQRLHETDCGLEIHKRVEANVERDFSKDGRRQTAVL